MTEPSPTRPRARATASARHEPAGPSQGRIPEGEARRYSSDPAGPPQGRIPEGEARRYSSEPAGPPQGRIPEGEARRQAGEPRLARVAALVADPARSRMLAYLLSGEVASATELARAASVTPATASGHLARLLEGGFVSCEPRGRHRYYRLADADVAHALEALALVAERGEHDRAWASPGRRRLREARCCYGHLAGRLGVALYDTLRRVQGLALQPSPDDAGRGAHAGDLSLTPGGQQWLQTHLGFHPPAPQRQRRYAYACLDWSERRDHLAGQLAAALLQHCLDSGWLRRDAGRAVAVTPLGYTALLPLLHPA